MLDTDPYDDYDPREYVYHSEEEEEDEVVYMDHAGLSLSSDALLNLSPSSQQNPTQSQLSQKSMHLSQQQQQQKRQPRAPTLLPRRNRKRKQQQQQQGIVCQQESNARLDGYGIEDAHHQYDCIGIHDTTNNINNNTNNNNSEECSRSACSSTVEHKPTDIFASLHSYLEGKKKQEEILPMCNSNKNSSSSATHVSRHMTSHTAKSLNNNSNNNNRTDLATFSQTVELVGEPTIPEKDDTNEEEESSSPHLAELQPTAAMIPKQYANNTETNTNNNVKDPDALVSVSTSPPSSISSLMQHELQRQKKLRVKRSKLPTQPSTYNRGIPSEQHRATRADTNIGAFARTYTDSNSMLDPPLSQTAALGAELDKARRRKQTRTTTDSKRSFLSQQLSHSDGATECVRRQKTKESQTQTQHPFNNNASVCANSVIGSRSIVGSRPLHWGTPRQQPQAPLGRSLSQSNKNTPSSSSGGNSHHSKLNTKKYRAAQLAEATKPRRRRSLTGNSSTISMTLTGSVSDPKNRMDVANQSQQQQIDRINTDPFVSTWQPYQNTDVITFTPAFLASSNKKSSMEIVDDPHSLASNNGTTISNSAHVITTPGNPPGAGNKRNMGSAAFSAGSSGCGGSGNSNNNSLLLRQNTNRKGGGSGRKTRIKAGPLMQQLRAIRGSVEGDWVRFQSGMYPFQISRRHDTNDPRNRSRSLTDVTIIGEPIPYRNESNQRVMVLGMIHSHVVQAKGKTTVLAANCDAEDRSTSVPCARGDEKDSLAWICFTYDTVREQKVRQGTQLRMYNAIIMKARQELKMEIECFIGNETKRKSCQQVVLCSKLCEPYHKSLPPLVYAILAKCNNE